MNEHEVAILVALALAAGIFLFAILCGLILCELWHTITRGNHNG